MFLYFVFCILYFVFSFIFLILFHFLCYQSLQQQIVGGEKFVVYLYFVFLYFVILYFVFFVFFVFCIFVFCILLSHFAAADCGRCKICCQHRETICPPGFVQHLLLYLCINFLLCLCNISSNICATFFSLFVHHLFLYLCINFFLCLCNISSLFLQHFFLYL